MFNAKPIFSLMSAFAQLKAAFFSSTGSSEISFLADESKIDWHYSTSFAVATNHSTTISIIGAALWLPPTTPTNDSHLINRLSDAVVDVVVGEGQPGNGKLPIAGGLHEPFVADPIATTSSGRSAGQPLLGLTVFLGSLCLIAWGPGWR